MTEEDVQMLSTKAGGTVMGIYKDYKNEMLGYSDNGKKIPEWVDYHNTLDDTLGLKQSDYIMAYQTTPQSGKGFIVIDVKASAIQQFLDSLDMGDGRYYWVCDTVGKRDYFRKTSGWSGKYKSRWRNCILWTGFL